MKIVSWNCCGKFREKFKKLISLDADILVIQECEDPKKYPNSEYGSFFANYIWIGENDNKGLAVFAKDNISILNNDWDAYCLRNFVSVRVNGEFDLLAVWACRPYIEEYYVYQAIHLEKIKNDTVIIGDFNSNAVWDKSHGARNHTAVVQQLTDKELVSAYHFITDEEQGNESANTFYLYRHADKGYHIDYAFVSRDRVSGFEVLESDDWLAYSDHIPIVLTIDC